MRRAFVVAALAAGVVAAAAPRALAQAPPPGFVDAVDVVAGLRLDIRYAGANNFVGRPIVGYEVPRCILTREAAEALALVQKDLAPRGLGLKAFDCYRPARAVTAFEKWATDRADAARKRDFYPDIDKRDLFRLGYVGRNSRHSRGSTIDVTLVDLASGRDLDMGTPFDFMSPTSGVAGEAGLAPIARTNRALLRAAMERRGYESYAREWWHFFLRGEPFPATSFDFPVR